MAHAGLFEVVIVPPAKMEALTGKSAWRMIEELPNDFIEQIIKNMTVRVMFSIFRLQAVSAVEHRLANGACAPEFESNNGTVVWEFDEVFNAGEKHVINSAIRNGVKNGLSDPDLDYDFGLLNSPRRFGRYTAEEVVRRCSAW